ncbi:MAG: hypothetical protein HUJ27_16760 [Rhodobacteraceae bacterium]|nr:hypothetical protein [Paracoccaceae bacterium]
MTLAIRIIGELYQTNEDLGLCLGCSEVFPLLELELADTLQPFPDYPEIGSASATHFAFVIVKGLCNGWLEFDGRLEECMQYRGEAEVA